MVCQAALSDLMPRGKGMRAVNSGNVNFSRANEAKVTMTNLFVTGLLDSPP